MITPPSLRSERDRHAVGTSDRIKSGSLTTFTGISNIELRKSQTGPCYATVMECHTGSLGRFSLPSLLSYRKVERRSESDGETVRQVG